MCGWGLEYGVLDDDDGDDDGARKEVRVWGRWEVEGCCLCSG